MKTSSFTSFVRSYVPRLLRNALRNPSATLERTWRKLRYASGHTDQVQVRADWTVRCHPLCVEAFTQFKDDPSQQAELNSIVARCTRGMQLLDIGAHWGFLTLACLHFGGETARSIAAEPSGAAAALFKINAKLNSCMARTTLVNKAVGQAPGTVEMLTTGAGGNDYFVVPSEKRPDTHRVPQTSIDEICSQFVYQPTHVKIDVEGFEEEVLLGGRNSLPAHLPTIFLELHGDLIRARLRNPEQPLRLLESFGYRQFQQGGNLMTMRQLEAAGYMARLVCTAR